MKKLSYSCALGKSEIYLGHLELILRQFPEYVTTPLLISNRVASLYPWLIRKRPSYLFPDDANIKNLNCLQEIYHQFLRWQLDRSSLVAICGGGSLCDLAAFAASTYMRGISFILIPTTLLAQVDAAIGGKTAIDFQGYKNLIGTLALPRATFIDPGLLLTLETSEILNGLAEVVKHALIASPTLFSFLKINWSHLLSLDLEIMEQVILASLEIKITIVSEDIREKGKRRLLNFGHTFGHALEKELNLSHGQAVVWGMILATYLSLKLKALELKEAEEIISFLRLNFNFSIPPTFNTDSFQKVLKRLEADKKRSSEMINFVLLKKIGQAVIHPIHLNQLKELLYDLCQSGKYFL